VNQRGLEELGVLEGIPQLGLETLVTSRLHWIQYIMGPPCSSRA
jgi:hypothetical protein